MAKVLVVGAGAVGGTLAAQFSMAGHEVCVVARGLHLQALRERGCIHLKSPLGMMRAPVTACASVASAPDAQFLIVTLKAYQLPEVFASIAARARVADALITTQNGIPWWYFRGLEGPFRDRVVRAADPDGSLMAQSEGLPLVPAIVSMSAEVEEPGVVRTSGSPTDGLQIGPVDPQDAGRAIRVAELVRSTGLQVKTGDIRQWVWLKLLSNVWANPIGALTGATIGRTACHPASRVLALALMEETRMVARAMGMDPGIDFLERLDYAARLRMDSKCSMLQDLERGRRTERGVILEALAELAALAGLDVPEVRALAACVALAEEVRVGGTTAGG